MSDTHQAIRTTFAELRRASKARHRDIADTLKISEGELIAAHAGLAESESQAMLQATRLRAEWALPA